MKRIFLVLILITMLVCLVGCNKTDVASRVSSSSVAQSSQASSFSPVAPTSDKYHVSVFDMKWILNDNNFFAGFGEDGSSCYGIDGIIENGRYRSKKAGIEFDIREWPAEDKEDFFRLEIAVVSCSFMSRVETGRKFLTVAFETLYTGVEKDDEYNREEESQQIARNVENIIEAYKEQGYDLIEERAYESEIAGRRCQSVLLSCEELDMKMSVNYYIVHTDRYRDGVIIITADESEQKIEQTLSSIRPFRHSA